MRKNKMMRLASVLLVLVLLTTSVISGTFAKYITTDSADASARVAKWGVVASVKGDLFGSTYAKADNNIINYETTGGSVSSVNGEFVVAPGTQNIKGLYLSVSGIPEVATHVILDAAEDEGAKNFVNSDIYLKAGVYGVMVEYKGVKTAENCKDYFVENNGTYTVATSNNLNDVWYELNDKTVATEYYPLDWYVNEIKVANQKAVEEALKNTFDGKEFKPNTENKLDAIVGWAWSWTGEGGAAWNDKEGDTLENTVNDDKMDTVLGNMMVGTSAKVVMQNGDGNYVSVSYAEVDAETMKENQTSANMIKVAYVGESVDANNIVACLTVAFNARLTVEQVD